MIRDGIGSIRSQFVFAILYFTDKIVICLNPELITDEEWFNGLVNAASVYSILSDLSRKSDDEEFIALVNDFELQLQYLKFVENYYLFAVLLASDEDHEDEAADKAGRDRADRQFYSTFDFKKILKDKYILCDSINCIQKLIDSGKFVLSHNGKEIIHTE